MGSLQEPVVPVGGEPTQAENVALAQALTSNQANGFQDLMTLEGFLKDHPHSPWAGSVRLNLGLLYHHYGRFTESIANFKQSWELMRDSQEPRVKALADRALGELAISLAHWGRYEELEPLLKQVRKRSVTGPATELLSAARDGLYGMKTDVGHSFLCGPYALRGVCRALDKDSKQAQQIIEQVRSTKQGTSLDQVRQLSQHISGVKGYQMAFRNPGSAILTPAVMHLKVNHFCAILSPKDGLYPIEDATAGYYRHNVVMAPDTLDRESTGYFLVAEGALPAGWRKVSPKEGARIWGRGHTGNLMNIYATSTTDVTTRKRKCDSPMTTWNVHAMLVSLSLSDSPVGTSNAAFAIPFTIFYSQRDAVQPAVPVTSNLGPKWTHNYLSFIEPPGGGPFGGSNLNCYLRGGGAEQVIGPNTPTRFSQAVYRYLVDGFIRELPDGSSEVFKARFGNRMYLSEIHDQHNNVISLQYDSQQRLVSITDSSNRVMSIVHGLPQDPLKITRVVDFAGRAAEFTYQADGRLASCQDILGIISSYHWIENDFIDSLTTPYGTTNFSHVDNSTDDSVGNSRVLTVTDPAGRNYRTEFRHSAPGVADHETSAPVGMPLINGFLQYRNTFFWEPQALTGPLDYNKATVFHWLHSLEFSSGQTSRVLESMKKPLENRVWYAYPDQPIAAEGTSTFPTHVGRVLGDGTTQLDRYTRVQGRLTQHIDPMGRIFDYHRAPNGLDLLSVETGGQTPFSATYDNNHNITTLTDASGGTSLFTYDSRGLLQTATNALGETTAYGYTPTGNLNSIQSPLSATTTFAYNGAEQLVSATDSEGYTVTAQYDEADRPVSVTYPDGTTETITYDKLDVASTKDRKDRVTTLQHDPIQRLTQVTDANGGNTLLGYGLEDAPNLLTDPSGRQTAFAYDLHQRLVTKQYAGGATQTIDYQNCCGRLRTITDALGHVKTFSYFLDNTLKTIDYSGATPDVTFTNDPFLPRPLSMTDGQGTTQYSYVPVGSPGGNGLASVTGPLGDVATLQYDIAGRMTGRTVNGASETQNFDALWRTTSTTNALDTFTMSYLGTTGQVTGVNSTSGPSLQYAYGSNLQDRRLAQIKNLGSAGVVHSQFDFTTNPVGEITQIIETHGGGSGTPTPTPTNTTTPDADADAAGNPALRR
jgi:YD repeat-containing protein